MKPEYSQLTERDREKISELIALRREGRSVDIALDWLRDRLNEERRTYPRLYYPDQED